MSFIPSTTPTLTEVIQAAIYQALQDLHTMIPGKIVSYDAPNQKAAVQPLIQRPVIYSDGTVVTETLPVIQSVPILFPRGGALYMRWTLEVDDHVMLVFAERSLDAWLSSNGSVIDPIDPRTHDLSDAVAIPGLLPFSKAIFDAVPDKAITIGSDRGGMQVNLTADKIEAIYKGEQVFSLIESADKTELILGSGSASAMIAQAFTTFWTSTFKIWADTHGHPAPSAPPSTPCPPADPGWESSHLWFPEE